MDARRPRWDRPNVTFSVRRSVKAKVGTAPLTYLIEWQMTLARDALRNGRWPTPSWQLQRVMSPKAPSAQRSGGKSVPRPAIPQRGLSMPTAHHQRVI